MAAEADLRCDIVAWVDDEFPGWVEATFTDVDGRVWRFRDKAPVLDASGTATRDAFYPRPGVIGVHVLDDGEIVRVECRWSDSEEGESVFRVRANQLDR